MDINLALILTVLTAISGVIVALDKYYLRKRRPRQEDGNEANPGLLVEYSQSFFPVLLFVLIIRSFIFEPFRIPSGSMMPTLLQGDYIFVKKYSYGLRLPVLESKVLETGAPERGDVAVFPFAIGAEYQLHQARSRPARRQACVRESSPHDQRRRN